jgi:hypothetical protein
MFSAMPSLIKISITIIEDILPILPLERVSCVRMGDCGELVTSGRKQSVCLCEFLLEVEEKMIGDG